MSLPTITPVPTASERGKMTVSQPTKLLAVVAIAAIILLPLLHFIPTATRIGGPLYEKRVCAFYYTWYRNTTVYPSEFPGGAGTWDHWNQYGHTPPTSIGSKHHPTMNTSNIVLFDSGDPAAIRFHLDCATYAGINTFITTWWGPGNYVDHNFGQLLNVTEMDDYDMVHTIYFETVSDRYNKTKPWGLDNLVSDMEYVLYNYGNHSKFLKVDGRPVLFIYATTSTQPVSNWSVAIQRLNDDGYNPFLIVDLGGPKAISSDWLQVFDGFHVYNPLGIYQEEPQNALSLFETMVLSARANGKLACVTTLPGYDDTEARAESTVLQRQGGSVYDRSWSVAKKANPDWTLICTFNEWHEGTEIEPSLENGTYFIDATRDYVRDFMA
jgi:glycoprotein endo-alpha-1,2-mannosidase